VLSGKSGNTHFVVFGLIPLEIQATTFHARSESVNHYITEEYCLYINVAVVVLCVS